MSTEQIKKEVMDDIHRKVFDILRLAYKGDDMAYGPLGPKLVTYCERSLDKVISSVREGENERIAKIVEGWHISKGGYSEMAWLIRGKDKKVIQSLTDTHEI